MTMAVAKKLAVDILEARKKTLIQTDDEMERKLCELLNDDDVRAALFNGDDIKSWYGQMSEWKKVRFDGAYKKWKESR